MKGIPPWRLFTVSDKETGQRIDVWLTTKPVGLSRRQAARMVEAGEVTVSGRAVRKSYTLRAGESVALWSEPAQENWTPKPDPESPLVLLYEDEHIVAVEKPSGTDSVPLGPEQTGTLAGALVSRYPECAGVGRSPGDGGLLHRLDRGTSGVVLAARSQSMHDALVREQELDQIEKNYLALVMSEKIQTEPPRLIDLPLLPTGSRGHKMRPAPNGLTAATRVHVVEKHGEKLLVRAAIHSGRRHQIRVHLAAVGFPILGDDLYGGEKAREGAERLFLHAHQIRFVHPYTKEQTIITSELPRAFNQKKT